jgi:hypothetical protein
MSDVQARLDRIESILAIQQLPMRYALAVDGRDIDGYVDLFIADVNCGKYGIGRVALRQFIELALRNFYRSQHFLCGHQIEFKDADHATGKVYCRAEHEDGLNWVVMAICYFDTYVRREGVWFFARRQEKHWYASDMLSRPLGPHFTQWSGQPEISEPALPGDFPNWRNFWERAGGEVEGKRTNYPVT